MKRENPKSRAAQAQEIDLKLESVSQSSIANVLRELPDEPVSLAWRSELNGKLQLSAKRQVKRRWMWRMEASLGGLALAGALAVGILFMRAPTAARPSADGLEGSLLQEHRDMTTSDDVAGAGLTFYDAARQKQPASFSGGDPLGEGDTESL